MADGEYDFPAPYWDVISDGARDLVERLLVVEPTQRMTAAEGLDHTWILNLAGASSPPCVCGRGGGTASILRRRG